MEEYVCYRQHYTFLLLAWFEHGRGEPPQDLMTLLLDLTDDIIDGELIHWDLEHQDYLPEQYLQDWVPLVDDRYVWKELT